MNDSKQKIDIYKNEAKYTKKQHLKSSKNKNIPKNNNNNSSRKVPGLKLSRIEEFIEIGHGKKGMDLKERLLETCVLKNIKHLILNKENENNKGNDNNMIGYTIDNKNKTIIKFNKSPNQLQIEQFIFPGKSPDERRGTSIFNFQNDSFDKIELNNISDNINSINFLQKFKGNYPSDPEDKKKNSHKVKSNIISSKKLKKEIKSSKYKNTVMIKHSDIENILGDNIKNNKKAKSKEKESNNQKEKQKSKSKETNNLKEKNKIKVKDIRDIKEKEKEKENGKEEEHNNSKKLTPNRRKNKSKTKKQPKITFQINKEKKMTKKNSDIFSNNNFIDKIEASKKTLNNDNVINNEDYLKKISKNRIKSTNIRKGLKSYYFERIDSGKSLKNKKSRRNRIIKFKSLLFPKKRSMFDPKNKDLLFNKKRNSNIDKNESYNENNSFYKEKKIKVILNSDSEEKKHNKIKPKKNQNHLKLYKEDLNYSSSIKCNEINDNKYISSKLKDNKEFKSSKNLILNNSKYKIKHVNDINVIGNKNINPIIKMPAFSVVQPDKLIFFEFNRAYERPNNNINNFLVKKSEDMLGEKDTKNKNNINDNEESVNEDKKINKKILCCL